jgi:protein gp37
MENSSIEWTDHTFNPWFGCTKVSPGCANCYAETLMDTRYGKVKWGKGQPRVRTSAANWRKPIQWNREAQKLEKRPRVFCASLSDWLDDEVPVEWLSDLMRLIVETPNLDWLLLTKRPQNFKKRIEAAYMKVACGSAEADDMMFLWESKGIAPLNIWVGTSVEDQQRADERIPHLLQIPARVRFLSCEPLLGPVKLPNGFNGERRMGDGLLHSWAQPFIDWVIAGGESGPGARPMMKEWVVSLRDQCQTVNAAFHFKQWGGTNKKATGRILEGRTYDELPV